MLRLVVILLSSVSVFGVNKHEYGFVDQPFQPCIEVGYEIKQVLLDLDCPFPYPCCLPAKKAVNATISFKAINVQADDIKSSVYAVIEGSMRECDVTPKNCPSNICPIYENDEKQYSAQFLCDIHVDPVLVSIYWEMFNHKGQKLFCFYVPLFLYDPNTDDCGLLRGESTDLKQQRPAPKNKFSKRH